MGFATFGIGLLPTYDHVSLWAPVALVALRLLQGFASGGEWGGGVLMISENAPFEEAASYCPRRRFSPCSSGVRCSQTSDAISAGASAELKNTRRNDTGTFPIPLEISCEFPRSGGVQPGLDGRLMQIPGCRGLNGRPWHRKCTFHALSVSWLTIFVAPSFSVFLSVN
ncbi:hypothetical protein CBA19CS22_13945 [Caballeronia novacaledonica]|uniref:Uncharacterized protein n=1 Tax=Caballeronia novacaledonica TaxID=1544861 RepID=A0ACB5QRS0_9BURK|nr:hypothetical protein CBA19CS22_13945 [Caballeronia novacaledonica]